MAVFRATFLRAATSARRSIQAVPRTSRQFTTQLAPIKFSTPSFVSFQRRLYSDDKDAAQYQGEESIQTDNEPLAEESVTGSAPAESTEFGTQSGFDRAEHSSKLLELPVSTNLYVGNLLFDLTEEDLKKEFAEFGDVSAAKIVKDQQGFSKGFGFVAFSTESEAEAAKTKMDGIVVQGRRLIVNFTRRQNRAPSGPIEPSSTLFVGNLSYNLSDRELNALFRPLRNIRDVRIAIDRRSGQPRGFAHADFTDVKSAQDAYEKLQGHEVGGRILRIDYSQTGRSTAIDNYRNNRKAADDSLDKESQ